MLGTFSKLSWSSKEDNHFEVPTHSRNEHGIPYIVARFLCIVARLLLDFVSRNSKGSAEQSCWDAYAKLKL
jgi:hypothetical protein